ncbi:ABC transporter ATP-binding protein [Flavobacterium okayamense]|uniref:ABC transporter ATP-binding protein n=1 Tax=Flavobacterium okayamense TaxID=2830782 RepID=A0ABM7S592_9FLAO|nr:ATP-binding cassette domain-containing protein [Flavobacterium okayamense]BCY28632.1 ABC transporter ATP-binding protein [Flavobacterium okayamense]
MIQSESIIKIENLLKQFGNNVVLNDFNLDLHKGENLVVMGKSGSGKSVMIKCIVGLENYDKGSIKVNNYEIKSLNRKDLDALRTEIGFLFQGSALYDSMSVRENLEFPLRRHQKKRDQHVNLEALVIEALENVGLVNAIDLMPSELSGGMKRRIALARTLILKPSIILYDEPTSGLDPITSKEIIQLMKSIQKKYNTSSIIITHDLDCAKAIANRIILLIDGKNYAEGTFEELQSSNDVKIKAFFK